MLESWCVSLLFAFVSQNIQLVFRERERERQRDRETVGSWLSDLRGVWVLNYFKERERERERERDICVGLQFAWFHFWGVYYLSIWIFFKAYLHKAGKITNKNYFLIVSTPLYV